MKQDASGVMSLRLALLCIFCVIMLLVMFRVVLSIFDTTPPLIPEPGSLIDLRGNRVLLLRNVSKEPYFGLGVHTDQYASLFPYPEQLGVVRKLTDQEWRDITLFREQWCKGELKPSQSELEDQTFDFGVRCNDNSFEVKQGKVAADDIPLVLLEIIQRLRTSEQ